VNGTRVNGERRLHGSPVIRFGAVTAIFRPRDVAAEARKGGQGAERPQLYNTLATALPPVPAEPGAPAPAARPRSAGSAATVRAPEPQKPQVRPVVLIGAILVLILAAAFYVFYP